MFIPFSFARNQKLRERIILNSEMADVNSNFNSAVGASLLELVRQEISRVLRNQKVKAISTQASGQDLLASLKPPGAKSYTSFTSRQIKNAACSNTFFFSGGFIMLWTVLCFE